MPRTSVRPSVCLSVRLSVPLGPARHTAPRPGTRAVRTAHPSAHGCRSAAIGGGRMSSRRAITCFYHDNFFQLISIALLLFYRFMQKIILVLITIFQLTKIELLTTISTRLHSQQTTCRSVHVESSRAACCIRRLILREVRRF